MDERKENINFWIGRVFIIILLLIVITVFKSDGYSKGFSADNSSTNEIVFKVENSAILVESISLPDYTSSSVLSEPVQLNTKDKENLEIVFSNIKANLLLRIGIDRFHKVKTHLVDITFYNIRNSLKNEDCFSIS